MHFIHSTACNATLAAPWFISTVTNVLYKLRLSRLIQQKCCILKKRTNFTLMSSWKRCSFLSFNSLIFQDIEFSVFLTKKGNKSICAGEVMGFHCYMWHSFQTGTISFLSLARNVASDSSQTPWCQPSAPSASQLELWFQSMRARTTPTPVVIW